MNGGMPGSLAGSQLKSSPLTHSAPWPAAHAPKLPGWVRQERRFSVGSVILGAGGKNLFGHLVTHPPVPNRGGVSGKKVSIRTHSSDGRRLLPKSDPPTPAGVWGACQENATLARAEGEDQLLPCTDAGGARESRRSAGSKRRLRRVRP